MHPQCPTRAKTHVCIKVFHLLCFLHSIIPCKYNLRTLIVAYSDPRLQCSLSLGLLYIRLIKEHRSQHTQNSKPYIIKAWGPYFFPFTLTSFWKSDIVSGTGPLLLCLTFDTKLGRQAKAPLLIVICQFQF